MEREQGLNWLHYSDRRHIMACKPADTDKEYCVTAGIYGSNDKCKYIACFATLGEAIKALSTPEVQSYPWVYLEHRGKILDPQIR